MVNWLLQTDIFDENLDELKSEIDKQRHVYDEVSYSPFVSGKDYIKGYGGAVVFYGSLNFGQQILRETSWIPGVYCDLPQYLCTNYYPKLRDYLFNSDFCMLPLGCVDYSRVEHLSDEGLVFVRPNDGFKSFTGQLVDLSDKNWLNQLKAFESDETSLVLISSPANIRREWRLVVTDKVISGSQYKEDGKIKESSDVPQEVIDYTNMVLKKTGFRPEPIWTMDVCECGDELSVLEIGCFSCAGLYASKLGPIVEEASRLAQQDWDEIYAI